MIEVATAIALAAVIGWVAGFLMRGKQDDKHLRDLRQIWGK